MQITTTNDSVFVIAEIGNCHEGDVEVAKKMIGIAADCGVDAVKFQTFRTEHYVSPADKNRFETLKRFELSWAEFEELKRVADSYGVPFLSTPFDVESAVFLNDLVPAFKIASGDNTFYPLIEKVAGFCKPIILSTGLSDLDNINKAKQCIEQTWNHKQYVQELALLHCVTSYPVPVDQTNLFAIQELKEHFQCVVGYSDHTLGIDAAVLSVAAGATIIEKHFTLDHDYSMFGDHKISADPQEMKLLVEKVREAHAYCGSRSKVIYDCERPVEVLVRRSIAAARDISAGQTITSKDITWIRPGDGIPSGDEALVLGKVAACDIKAYSLLSQEMVKVG